MTHGVGQEAKGTVVAPRATARTHDAQDKDIAPKEKAGAHSSADNVGEVMLTGVADASMKTEQGHAGNQSRPRGRARAHDTTRRQEKEVAHGGNIQDTIKGQRLRVSERSKEKEQLAGERIRMGRRDYRRTPFTVGGQL